MTSTRGLELAGQIVHNNPDAAGPAVKLLYAFKNARNDPEAEAMMDEVLMFFYSITEQSYKGMEAFASDELKVDSIAA